MLAPIGRRSQPLMPLPSHTLGGHFQHRQNRTRLQAGSRRAWCPERGRQRRIQASALSSSSFLLRQSAAEHSIPSTSARAQSSQHQTMQWVHLHMNCIPPSHRRCWLHMYGSARSGTAEPGPEQQCSDRHRQQQQLPNSGWSSAGLLRYRLQQCTPQSQAAAHAVASPLPQTCHPSPVRPPLLPDAQLPSVTHRRALALLCVPPVAVQAPAAGLVILLCGAD